MDSEQRFKIYCSNISKSLDPNYNTKSKTQPLILEGVASTSDIDLEGDFITPQCIESFKLQATQCNIHNNHNVGLDDVIGTVLEVMDTDNKTLKIKFSILPLFRRHIEECIDNGVKLGLSIGGTIIDYDMEDDGLKIKNMMLHEISLTPLPANWNTMGTVEHSKKSIDVIEAKCLNGVCKQFLNTLETQEPMGEKVEEDIMEMEKRYYTKDEESQFMSEDRVVELINEALNNFAKDSVTEERVAEIIDAKLKDFVEQAKALEKEEKEREEKLKEEEEKKRKAKARAKKEKEAEEEEEEEEELEDIEKADEEEEEEEEEEKSKKGKKGKKTQSSISDLTPQEFGKLIAQAVQLTQKAQEPQEPQTDFFTELEDLREDLHNEITKAMSTTRDDIEKSIFDGLMKSNTPSSRSDDVQIKKFLKTKSEKQVEKSNTLNVKDIAKTLARKE